MKTPPSPPAPPRSKVPSHVDRRSAPPSSARPSASPPFVDVSSAIVRSMLRYAGREGLSQETLVARCGEAAQRVAAELVARGFVEPAGENGKHLLTAEGRAWTAASMDQSFNFATAQRAVLALMARAEAVIAGPNALFVPRRMALFGEMLDAPTTLGRVDVGIHLVLGPRAEQIAQNNVTAEAKGTGPNITSEDWLALRERAVWTHLAGRSPVLRLFPLDASSGRGVELYPHNEAEALLLKRGKKP